MIAHCSGKEISRFFQYPSLHFSTTTKENFQEQKKKRRTRKNYRKERDRQTEKEREINNDKEEMRAST